MEGTATILGTRMAVFVGTGRSRSKTWTNATVSIDDGRLIIERPGAYRYDYEIVETVKAGMAWDVMRGATLTRIAAQSGCGCGGMKKYAADAGYSGAISGV